MLNDIFIIQQNQQQTMNRIIKHYSSKIIFLLWMKHCNLPMDVQQLILIFSGHTNTKMQIWMRKGPICRNCFLWGWVLPKITLGATSNYRKNWAYHKWLCSNNISHIFDVII